MISPTYYQPENTAQLYLGGRIRHYLHKRRTVTVESRTVVLNYGETLYSKAAELFGDENEAYWSILADNMPVRHPDLWGAGDEIRLPRTVLTDFIAPKTRYAAQPTPTTAIPR